MGRRSGTSAAATLDVLRAVSGDGVFYLRTHGGAIFRIISQDEDFYGLWTATPALDPEAEKNDPKILDDLKNKRIGYMLFRNTRWTRAFPFIPEDRHYGITHRFIQQYMSFEPNSLIYIDACDGATWPFVRDAFKSKGASVFAGWDERALFSAMSRTAKFVFDRLLGANVFEPENPPQRPFNYQAISSDPKFGTGKTYGYSVGTDKSGGPILATLGFHHLQGEFGLLAPSIRRMEVDEVKEELTLHGLFGPDPGTDREVKVGGVLTSVTSWEEEKIQVELGPTLVGDVVVKLRDHESNPTPLTEWMGEFRYTVDASPIATLPPFTLLQEVNCTNLHIRADVHDYRETPGASPTSPAPTRFVAARDSKCTWEFSGSGTNPFGLTVTLTGSGTFPWQDPSGSVGDPGLVLEGELDAVAGTLTFSPGYHPTGFFPYVTGTATACDPNACVNTPIVMGPALFANHAVVGLGDDFGIVSGFIDGSVPTSPPLPIRLTWDQVAAGSPPTPDTPARVGNERCVSCGN